MISIYCICVKQCSAVGTGHFLYIYFKVIIHKHIHRYKLLFYIC